MPVPLKSGISVMIGSRLVLGSPLFRAVGDRYVPACQSIVHLYVLTQAVVPDAVGADGPGGADALPPARPLNEIEAVEWTPLSSARDGASFRLNASLDAAADLLLGGLGPTQAAPDATPRHTLGTDPSCWSSVTGWTIQRR